MAVVVVVVAGVEAAAWVEEEGSVVVVELGRLPSPLEEEARSAAVVGVMGETTGGADNVVGNTGVGSKSDRSVVVIGRMGAMPAWNRGAGVANGVRGKAPKTTPFGEDEEGAAAATTEGRS